MKPKAIFLDIDGTLTEPGTNVPPASALEAIRRAQEAGNYVFLCTGRNYAMLSPLLKYGFDGVVASSGGYVACRDEVIYDSPMTDEERDRMSRLLKENGIFRTIECVEGAFTDDGFKNLLREHANEGENSEMLPLAGTDREGSEYLTNGSLQGSGGIQDGRYESVHGKS